MSLADFATGGPSGAEVLGALDSAVTLPARLFVESDLTVLCEWIRRVLGRECGWTIARPGVLTFVVQGTAWERDAVRAIIEEDVPVGAVVDVVAL